MNSPARWNSCVTSKSRSAVGSRLFGGTCGVAENWGHPPSTFSPKAGPGGALPCCILPTRALFSLLQALFFHFCASCWEILNGPQAWGCGTVELSCILKATRHVFSWGKTHVRQALFGYELSINETTIHPG